MSKIYIIEVHESGAGLLIQEPSGFRFYSADPTFTSLDGCLFRSPSEAEKVATRIGGGSPKERTESPRGNRAGRPGAGDRTAAPAPVHADPHPQH